jgi:anion-transporting  ArsA/GET3 family ATPase
MNPLLSRRVHFVAGKGGVGKSTVAVGLALVAARAGKRVLLVEIEHGGRAGAYLDLPDPAGYEARRSPSGVWTLTVDGRASLE